MKVKHHLVDLIWHFKNIYLHYFLNFFKLILPPVPLVVGVMDEVTNWKVSVVTDDVILAKPLLAMLILKV